MTNISASNSTAPMQHAQRPRLAWYLQRQWLRVLLLIVCGVTVRYPALRGDLIWDDEYLVRDNPLIRSPLLIAETFRHHLFLDSSSSHYRPVQNISYCFDYLLWKGNIYGYHISNVAWHVGSGVLLYLLLQRLLATLSIGRSGRPEGEIGGANRKLLSAGAFTVSLLWLVHPVHSAAIDYISGRADSLAAFFACGAWLLFTKGQSAASKYRGGAWYIAAAFSALLALGSRESAGIWVLLFLVHLFALDRRFTLRRKGAVLAACLVLMALYIGLRQLPTARGNIVPTGGSPMAVRMTLMARALGDYARLLVYPANLHMDRTVEAPESSLGNEGWRLGVRMEYLSVLGLGFAAVLVYGACRRGNHRPLRAFGAAWFVLAFLPISNLLELNATVAEHWLYLPSIGFFVFLLGCALELPPQWRRVAFATACIAVIGLGARSFVRSGDWLNAETFYRHSLASGSCKPRMALNLGLIYTAKGDYAKAEPLLRRVMAIEPDYPIAINALAHLLFREGKMDEAEKLFQAAGKAAEKTRNEYPRTWIAALNLASKCYRDHDTKGALAVAEKARADYPGTWDLISFESELLRELHGPAAAMPLVQEFLRDNWWHARATIALGKLYSEHGDFDQAEAAFRHASRLDVNGVEALNLMALLNMRQNRFHEAFQVQQRALSRQPDEPRQYLLLSDILQQMGRPDESRAALAQVTRLRTSVQGVAVTN